MRRLLPRSLAGQLAGVLIVALLAAHLVSLLLFFNERSRAIHEAIRFGVVERIVAIVEVIDDASPDVADRLARALSTRRTRLVIADASSLPAHGMDPGEARFAAELSEELALEAATPRVRFADAQQRRFLGETGHLRGPPDHARGGHERRERNRREHDGRFRGRPILTDVDISIPLSGGRWLNARSSFRTPPIAVSWPWLLSLGVSIAATLGAVALLVRRITGPMRALASAAERIGRGETLEPLALRGPAEIRTTVGAFNAMQERLSRFVRDRMRMVAAISHDLRTPITSLRLRAEFVDDEELRRDMIRTLDEMQALTDATLAFAREEGGGEATRTVDLAALVEGLVDDHRALGHDVVYEGPDRLPWRCRPVSLKRAVGNLVENAVAYGGPARVVVTAVGEEVRISVEDRGPGIPEERLEDVFEPFVRVETSRSRETGGVGLGLAIARTIVRAHGGELTLVNRMGGGLAATIALP